MELYKLTDQRGCTYNNTKWGTGITHKTSGKGDLCDSGWLHAYTDPYLAVLLDPIHASYGSYSLLWLAEGQGLIKDDHGLKVGVTKLTTIERLTKPRVSQKQCVAFAIYCALAVYSDSLFKTWANDWLDGTNRSAEYAWVTIANIAGDSAIAITRSAKGAARAAIAARDAAWATVAITDREAGWRAALTAEEAAMAHANLDLIALAHKACGVEGGRNETL